MPIADDQEEEEQDPNLHTPDWLPLGGLVSPVSPSKI